MDYDILYHNGDNLYAEDNGTITNHLSKETIFTIDAKWIAAARQGGTASVTYELQKRIENPDGTISWERVPTAAYNEYGEVLPDTMRDVLTISDFNAEAMEKQDRFGPVPKYDEAGNVIEYRVVQTELHRDDDNRHETYDTPVTESLTGHQAITVNGDQYEIRMTQDGDQYFFEYKIVGDQIIHIVKAWNDEENPAYAAPGSEHPTHADDIIEALVNHYNFTTNEYENAWIDDNEYTELNQQDHLIAHSNKRETWKTSIHAPMYDNEGHEYNYQVLEHNTFPNYDVKINFDPATKTYTIANVYSPDDTPEIEFEKEWQDDGDMLHRTPVHIWVDAAVYHTQQITTLQETNVWLEEVQRNDTYTYTMRTARITIRTI